MSPAERTARLAAIRRHADSDEAGGYHGQIVDDLIGEELPWLADEVERMSRTLQGIAILADYRDAMVSASGAVLKEALERIRQEALTELAR